MRHVKISPGNIKMGSIPSVSLPSIVTCRNCDCKKKCYAQKLERLRPSVRAAYQNNLDIFYQNPDQYWREVEGSIMMSRYFRFHVSGDFPNESYFIRMVEVVGRNKHCEVLCFTKRFEFVNSALANGVELPSNLHLIFSGWPGLEMQNPLNLPEAHVRFKDGTTTAHADAKECSGNCTECAITDGGCWTLKRGEQVVFNEH